MRKHTKRLLAFLLTLVMVVSLVNVKQFSVTAEAPETKTEVSRTETFTKTDTAVKSGDVKKEESKKDSSADEDEKQDKQENGESDTAALKDKADADDTADASGQKDQTAVQKEKDENDAGTADKQDADSKEDSKMEETEGKEAAEEDKKSDSVSNQTDTSSEKDKSGQTAATGQTNSGKTESSAAQKKEDTDTPTDNQKEDEKNNAVTDEKSDTVKDETDADDTLTYAQTARKALAKMGAAEAFAEGNTIPNADEYFTLAGNGEAQPESFVVKTGAISAETVPSITGYDFVNATIRTEDGDIEVKSVGMLDYDDGNGEKTYIYYTTEGSSTSLAAMVLAEGETITLHYERHRNTYDINYEVTGGSQTVEVIYGTDRPETVKNGESYAFRVTIPRGYTATVSVNGQEQGKLGIEPTYTGNNSTINVSGEPTSLTLSGIYEIQNVNAEQNVTVKLTKRNSYTFSAGLWTQTRYAQDDGTPRANFGQKEKTFWDVSESGWVELWSFTTNTTKAKWMLDSLQINGTKLNIPYRVGRSAETTLPSGTVVRLTYESNNNERRTYSISVSNCYENITVTGGNLNSTTWNEIILDRLTGVTFQMIDRTKSNESWGTLEQSEPFSVGEVRTERNYWFPGTYREGGTYIPGFGWVGGTTHEVKKGLRFALLPGYVNPTITYGTLNGIDDGDLNHKVINLSTSPEYDAATGQYWYYFDVEDQGSGNYQTLLRIEAEVGQYTVTYNEGKLATAGDQIEDLPEDSEVYNIIDNNRILISNQTPVDTTGKNMFDYWTLEGYEDEDGNPIPITPNQVLNLEDVAEYARQIEGVNYRLPLTAHWVDSSEAEQIQYTINLILRDGTDNGTIVSTEYPKAPKGSTVIIQKDAPEIQNVLERHTDYKWDDTNTVYYSNVQATTVINLYFVKNTTTVTIEKQVTGNMGDKNQKFNFGLTLDGEEQDDIQLADDDKKEITATIGDEITFGETNAEGYTVTVTYTDAEHTEPRTLTDDDSDGYYTATVTKDMHIIVTNDKQVHAPTGLSGGSNSWMILLGAAAVFAVTSGLYGLRRKKVGAHD
ncbi:MAG: hypothetical protein KH268_10045 [Clostridiales bacterium]|nr:hypothetical protein [Clostridiales bacterium]